MLYVDGARIGLTPVTKHRLSLGTHRLRVEQKGYQTLTETIVVKGTGPVIRRYDLRRRPAAEWPGTGHSPCSFAPPS